MRERRRRIKQMKKGKCAAFKQFVQHYQQSVYQFCYITMGNKQKAEALAMETFLYVYCERESFVAGRKFEIWLYQTAVKLSQNELNEGASNLDLMTDKVTGSHPTNNCVKKRQQVDIQSFLMNLSLKQRLALVLKSSNLLSIQEISEVLDTPIPEISTCIWQGRETLREKLHESTA